MIETEMQAMVVVAVNGAGGKAHKLSNRFLVGVSDLLIKLPSYQAGLLEVKRQDVGHFDSAYEFKLDVTALQKRFLKEFQAVGMPAGVASFMQRKGQGLKSLRFAVYTLDEIERRNYVALTLHHTELGSPADRDGRIIDQLNKWMEAWHAEEA